MYVYIVYDVCNCVPIFGYVCIYIVYDVCNCVPIFGFGVIVVQVRVVPEVKVVAPGKVKITKSEAKIDDPSLHFVTVSESIDEDTLNIQ